MESEIFRSNQKLIYEKLQLLVGPGPAAFYKDACYLMKNFNQLESSSHLVGHLMREIESAIRDVLKPFTSEKNNKKQKEKGEQTKKKEIDLIFQTLPLKGYECIKAKWFEISEKIQKKTHRESLESPRIINPEFVSWFVLFENFLSDLMDFFQKQFSVVFQRIDMLLQGTCLNAKELKNAIPNNYRIRTYFFEKCENPAWLPSLKKNGFFSNPPPPEQNKIDGTIKFMPWPQSRFLSKMASRQPDQVMKIILEIPDDGNIRVYEDLADAALRMPPEIALRLLEKAKKWLETSPAYLLLPTKLGDLVVHYANGGQTEAAFDLAVALFEILPDPKGYEDKDDVYSLPPNPKIRYETWDYIENIKKCLPKLLDVDGQRAFEFVCDLFDKMIEYSRRKGEASAPHDASAIWRPAIEDHEQNHPYDLKDNLVNEVRDAAEMLCRKDNSQISEVVKYLEERRWKVFHRIALHVIRVFADLVPDLAAERLTDWKLFDDEWTSHEYQMLLAERFASLILKKQGIILGWIDAGPDIKEYKNGVKKSLGRFPENAEIEGYSKKWRRDKLFIIKDGLDREYKNELDRLLEELGPPNHPTFSVYIKTGLGFASPKSVQEIQQMSVPEVIQFLKNWRPPTDPPFEPSPIGLGRTLSASISQLPTQYAINAEQFKDLDPTYIRHILQGLRDALSQNRSFDCRPVLNLCRWVLGQPIEIPNRRVTDWMEIDKDWSETRSAIARLLDEGFEARDVAIPNEFRETVWDMLACLTDDPEPTPDYEEKLGKNLDPMTLSINTNRGEAMHAVVKYALWIKHHIEKQPDSQTRIAKGFAEMPEVRKVLDHHLDVAQDPSLAVRAVYGQCFPWLVLLDKRWSQKNVPNIFPLEKEKTRYFFTAWDTYLSMNQAYDDVYDVLKGIYAYAVRNLGVERNGKRTTDPDEALSHHLMTLYWRGKLDLETLTEFWKNASPKLRGHATWFVGSSLMNTEGEVSSIFLDRLKQMWQDRLMIANAATDKENHKPEMAAFGFWLASGKFDDDWVLDQYRESLKVSGGAIELATKVMERMVQLVEKKPSEIIDCVRMIVEGKNNEWALHGILNDLRKILSVVLKTQVSDAAEEVVNTLLSLGHIEFRDLLENKRT